MEATIGIIILVITVLALIAGAVFMFLKSDFPHYPDRKEGVFRTTKARIWAQNSLLLGEYDAKDVAKAAYCVGEAWAHMDMPEPQKVREILSDVGVLITTREGFARWGFYAYNIVASVQIWTKDKFYSKNIPLAVVHEGTINRLKTSTGSALPNGQPLIHEMIHAVLDKMNNSADHRHADTRYWNRVDDQIALEETAQDFYRTLT